MTRYKYNAQVKPPAPFVHITLQNPADGNELRDVPAQLDIGADRTILPERVVLALGLAQMGTISVSGLGGVVQALPTYDVLLGLHDATPQPQEVLSADEPWVRQSKREEAVNARKFDAPKGCTETPFASNLLKESRALGLAASSPTKGS